MRVPSTNSRQQGFALLIVLLAVGFLALLGARVVAAGRADTQVAHNLLQAARLQAAADGAAAQVALGILASHARADGTVQVVRVGRIFVQVRVENESDRVNLNTASPMLLRALIIEAGGPAPAAAQLAAAIVDWRAAGATGASSVRSYQAAGLPYTPPHAPFRSVAELSDVVGMTSDLFARIAPHLTVMSDDDPAPSTRDPVVAKALADLGDTADANRNAPFDDHVLRMHMTAAGPGGSRLSTIEIVMTDFHAISPCLAVLFRYSN